MAPKKTPNAEQTVELMVETIRERILDRIDELESSNIKLRKGRSRGSYKRTNRATYDAIGKLEKQLKSLNRGLGAILTSDPNAVVNPKTKETWGGLVKSLLDENVQGEQLATKLESFQSFVYTSRKIVPGKVGHHRTALNILREVLKDKPFDYRTKFKEIAAKNGYQIGEEFVDFIDPAAHKEFTKHVKGKLNKLGIYSKTDMPKALEESLINRYAHAKQFGGNPGWEVPRGWLRDDVDPETLFKFSQPYLEASKRSSIAGLEIDDILEKGNWETPDDLVKQLDKVALNQTDDLFDIYGNALRPGFNPQFPLGETGVKNTQVSEEAVKKLGLQMSDINPHLLKDAAKDVMKWRKAAKTGALLGIGGVSVLGTGSSAAETTARTKIAAETGHWLDKTQAGISGFSLANDLGSYTGVWAVPGAILSTGADLTNLTIDSIRFPQSDEEQRIAEEKRNKSIKEQTEGGMYDFGTL